MTITDAWSVGTHTLTARDASNDSPQNSVSVTIVQPGQANTPGPKYLASAYQGIGHNITYNVTSNFALASIIEDGQGNISGNAIWTPPLSGSGPFTGKVNADNSLVFTSLANDGTGVTITFTGTVNSDGSLNGNYTANDDQIGTWRVSPA